MTIPKNISRITQIDDVPYRWTVHRQVLDNRVLLTFLAHVERPSNADTRQSKLRIVFDETYCSSVTPAVVDTLVRGALESGWDPKGKDHNVVGQEAIGLLCWQP
jgi:hypothetical protein